MNTQQYTIENIRILRPASVLVKGRAFKGVARIGGWLLDFPIVRFGDHGQCEVAIETLVYCLNNNIPVGI